MSSNAYLGTKKTVSPLLEVRNLCAGYGEVAVLHDVSFAVADGAITALIGSNGSGKTTAMRAVAGLLPTAPAKLFSPAAI